MAQNNRSSPVRIVGGGMTGLTIALRLAQQGYNVVVHERDPYLGGLSSEGELAGIPVERFYHCIVPTDGHLLGLLEEMGLGGEIGWNKTRTGFFTNGNLLEMTSTADFMRFPALRPMDRVRLAWTIAWCALNRDWRRLDREPISTFLIRHSGERVFRAIWEPLLLAKLGPRYDRFAASFIWATVYRMVGARKAKRKAEMLGYVRGRYGRVFAALRRAIEVHGGSVQAGSAVESLQRTSEETLSLRIGGKDLPASGIVLCVPAAVGAHLLETVAPDGAAKLRQVEYLGVVCEVILLRRSLSPYYVLNLTDKSLPFTGVVEMSNLTGSEEFKGHSLMYLPRYRDHSSPDWTTGDDAIHQENVLHLKRIFPDLLESEIVAWQVGRARFVQPVFAPGGMDKVPPVRIARHIAYVSTAQLHPFPVFNDEVVRHVERTMPQILDILKRQ